MHCIRCISPCNILAVNANTAKADMVEDFIRFSLENKAQKLNMNWYEPVTLDTFRSAVRGDGMDMDEDGLICELYMGDDMDSFLYLCTIRGREYITGTADPPDGSCVYG